MQQTTKLSTFLFRVHISVTHRCILLGVCWGLLACTTLDENPDKGRIISPGSLAVIGPLIDERARVLVNTEDLPPSVEPSLTVVGSDASPKNTSQELAASETSAPKAARKIEAKSQKTYAPVLKKQGQSNVSARQKTEIKSR